MSNLIDDGLENLETISPSKLKRVRAEASKQAIEKDPSLKDDEEALIQHVRGKIQAAIDKGTDASKIRIKKEVE